MSTQSMSCIMYVIKFITQNILLVPKFSNKHLLNPEVWKMSTIDASGNKQFSIIKKQIWMIKMLHLDFRHKHVDPANFQEKKPISMMLTQFISSITYVKKKKKSTYTLLVHKVDQVSTYGSRKYYWSEFS